MCVCKLSICWLRYSIQEALLDVICYNIKKYLSFGPTLTVNGRVKNFTPGEVPQASSVNWVRPGVDFASVHGLTSVTVHVSFSQPRATSRGTLPR